MGDLRNHKKKKVKPRKESSGVPKSVKGNDCVGDDSEVGRRASSFRWGKGENFNLDQGRFESFRIDKSRLALLPSKGDYD